MVEPNRWIRWKALCDEFGERVRHVYGGGPAPAPQDVDRGPRWNDASDSEDFRTRSESASKSSLRSLSDEELRSRLEWDMRRLWEGL